MPSSTRIDFIMEFDFKAHFVLLTYDVDLVLFGRPVLPIVDQDCVNLLLFVLFQIETSKNVNKTRKIISFIFRY